MFLRYEMVSSTDTVWWKPLSRWSSEQEDMVRSAQIEVEERLSSSPHEWLGVYDYERKQIVCKLAPATRRRVQ